MRVLALKLEWMVDNDITCHGIITEEVAASGGERLWMAIWIFDAAAPYGVIRHLYPTVEEGDKGLLAGLGDRLTVGWDLIGEPVVLEVDPIAGVTDRDVREWVAGALRPRLCHADALAHG